MYCNRGIGWHDMARHYGLALHTLDAHVANARPIALRIIIITIAREAPKTHDELVASKTAPNISK